MSIFGVRAIRITFFVRGLRRRSTESHASDRPCSAGAHGTPRRRIARASFVAAIVANRVSLRDQRQDPRARRVAAVGVACFDVTSRRRLTHWPVEPDALPSRRARRNAGPSHREIARETSARNRAIRRTNSRRPAIRSRNGRCDFDPRFRDRWQLHHLPPVSICRAGCAAWRMPRAPGATAKPKAVSAV